MKKLILLFSLTIVLFTGCVVVREYVADAKACMNDPACLEKAKASGTKGKEIGSLIGASIPFPGSAVAGALSGYGIMLLIALIRGGKKLNQEPVPDPSN